MFFIGKKDGGLRSCQDYCYLNKHTIPNAYPLPRIEDILDKIKNVKSVTQLDVR